MKVVKSLDIVNDYIEKLEQENKQLKKKHENAVSDYEQEHYKVVKAIKYIEQLPFNDLTPIEVKVIYKLLGDKESE